MSLLNIFSLPKTNLQATGLDSLSEWLNESSSMTQCDFLRVRSDFLQLTKDGLSQSTPLVNPDPGRGLLFLGLPIFILDSNFEILKKYNISMNRIEYYMNRNAL